MIERQPWPARIALAASLLLTTALLPDSRASAEITREQFLVRTTADLVALCSATEADPLYQAAIGFCHGYGVGTFHYYQTVVAAEDVKGFVCFPPESPSRRAILKQFVDWAGAHPQYMQERPVDTLFRFLTVTWPCSP